MTTRIAQDAGVTRQQWKWSVLAGMASYLDAGSIVALSAGLTLYQAELGLSSTAVGALAAIGPNAIGAAIGSVIGGRLGDRLGRKRIYKYDLLVYAAGIACIALAVNPAMLFAGTFVVGLAVGADVPTSLALVGEFSPARARARLIGLTQIAWYSGPIVVLALSYALSGLGLLGVRIVFGQLFVAALITWALRRGMSESARWQEASRGGIARMWALFHGKTLRALSWTSVIYLFWGLAAGTYGIFTPYMVSSLGAGSQATGVALSGAGFLIGLIAIGALFMPFADRGHAIRRRLWLIGSVLQVAAFVLVLVLPFTIPVIIANILLFYVGSALAGEAFYKVFSQELFRTELRGTAQGFTFGIARLLLGVWSLFVPVLGSGGFTPVAALLLVFLVISGVAGFAFMPDTAGKSLERIAEERAG
ncbi:MFS transporter [Sciscionella sediminilitoris]|uniref:MFS transporter n=1 Tax=Sciscionella sediminilitoris TaxID=1445613 RepID=UPI0004DF9A64|nr:MFS transporter [Sciscionella sp. SE31]